MTTPEGNRLILNYMGSNKNLNECSYHESIDALMPVVYNMVKDGYEVNINICKLKTSCSIVGKSKIREFSDPHLGTDVWKCVTSLLETRD